MEVRKEFSRRNLVKFLDTRGACPKKFRIWDELHRRWFQGGTDKKSRDLETDAIHFFGEIMIMEGTLFDQNEDGAWRDSPEIKSTLDMLQYLVVVQSTGTQDKNGQEIFEGDILETEDGLIGYVYYDKRAGSFSLSSPYHGDVLTLFENCVLKGNIFEHCNKFFRDLRNKQKWCSCCEDLLEEER